ncbi:MAG TPA: hypothetical protein VM121_03585 [Acidimicrobiales bacterium]|nr:hypothetical protein [Acidimicrobiales bacterium]
MPARLESGVRARLGDASRPWGHAVAIGAAAAAVLMAVTSTGDVILLGVLLGLAASDAVAGGVAILAGAGVIGRWGTSSLAALAGGQAVVGAGGWTGSELTVASTWGGALALLLVCPPGLAPAAAFGATAAQIVAGPALAEGSSTGMIALRVLVPLGGMVVAMALARLVPRPIARTGAVLVGVVAAGLAFAS